MPSIINSDDGVVSGTSGLKTTGGNDGITAFQQNGTERMRIDSSGNVGIGVTPATPLHVKGANNEILRLQSSDATTGSLYLSYVDSAGTEKGYVGYGSSVNNDFIISNALSGDTRFNTNGSERMRIDSSGNVGIGTTSPSYKLTVSGDGETISTIGGTTTGSTYLAFRGSTGTRVGYIGPASSGANSDFYIVNEANNAMFFYTNNTERARITSGGQMSLISTADGLHVGSTQASGTATWLYRGASAATAGTANSGTDRFFVFTNGNVTNSNGSYGTISDAKLKQDIIDAGSQWADIKNLRFRKYRMKSDVAENPNAPYLLGFVAQELETISPGLIEEHPDTTLETKTREVEKTREIPAVLDEDGNEVEPARTETYTETEKYTEIVDLGTTTKSIKTSILYMKAVKALQEAMTRIEALEAQNAAFEARLAALEAK